MAGEVPKGWRQKRMDEVARIVGGTTPPSDNLSFWGGSIPFVTPTDLTALEGRYVRATERSISENGRRAAGLEILPPRSILLATRASIGLVALNDIPVTTNQGFQNLVPLKGTDPIWLYYAVTLRKGEFERLAAGTTFRELSRRSLRAVELLLPPLSEQRAVAGVLDAIDEAIERTEAGIAATETLRKALLQELDTEFERRSRESRHLVDMLQCVIDHRGKTPKKLGGSFVSAGVPVISADNIRGGRLEIGDNIRYVSPAMYERWMKIPLQQGDILVTSEAPLGQVAYVNAEADLCLGQRLFAVRPDSSRLSGLYLYFALQSSSVQRQLKRRSTGTTATGVRQSELLRTRILAPPLPEQERIATTLSAVEHRLDVEVAYRINLVALKSVIADALLTGRLRVKTMAEA